MFRFFHQLLPFRPSRKTKCKAAAAVVVTERVVDMAMDILRLAVAEAVVVDNVAALAAPWAAMEHPVMDTVMIRGKR